MRCVTRILGLLTVSCLLSVGATAQSSGVLFAPGNPDPDISAQGAYLGWNALSMSGETDLINNQGFGQGAFAFFNSPDGILKNLLVYLMGDGTFLMGGLRNNTLSGDSRLAFPGYRDVVSPIIGATISSQRQSVWADNDVILTDLLFSTSDYQRVLNANPADPQTLWERMRITHEGLVGINTSAPSQILEVNGNIKLTANSGSGIYFDDGGPPQTTAWTGILPGVDYADSVAVSGIRADYEPGDVLIIDTAHPGSFVKTSKSYSTLVGGVYSTKPGVLGKRKTSETDGGTEVPLALNGIVPTKVSTENGPVHAGDLLVSATLPGYAMKGTDRSLLTGAVLGKALGSVESATGVIDVLIALQ